LKALNWLERDGLVQLAPRAATVEELATVHEVEYIREVEEACQKAAQEEAAGGRKSCYFATDTYVSARSYEAALKAAGAPLVAIDAIMKGEINNAYCLVRPPGHHALPESAMGFCIFNNVAVAARYAIDRYGLERVMIIDYDVHHGNGTQEMFYEDPRVLYFSLHQAPFYPGTGLSPCPQKPALKLTIRSFASLWLRRRIALIHSSSWCPRALTLTGKRTIQARDWSRPI
jgi:acetoin utilization deacetylase AcuC-like enzyme